MWSGLSNYLNIENEANRIDNFCEKCGAKKVNQYQKECYFCKQKFKTTKTTPSMRQYTINTPSKTQNSWNSTILFVLILIGFIWMENHFFNDDDYSGKLTVLSIGLILYWKRSKTWAKVVCVILAIFIGGLVLFSLLQEIFGLLLLCAVIGLIYLIATNRIVRIITLLLVAIGLKTVNVDIIDDVSFDAGDDVGVNNDPSFVDPHDVSGYERSDGTNVDGYWRDGDGNTSVNISKEDGGGYFRKNG